MRLSSVTLRPYVQGDLAAFSSLVSDGEVMQHTDGSVSVDDARALFAGLTEKTSDGSVESWAIIDNESESYIGHTALKDISQREAEIIVVLERPRWGKGIGTEVVDALISHAFSELDLERVIATIDSDHAAALHIAEKVGMTLLRWDEDAQGRYPVYSIDAEQWRARLIREPKLLVEGSYDRMSGSFADWASGLRNREREKYVAALMDMLPDGSSLLELGCGDGLRTTRQLASRYTVTGVDISSEQIALAKANVPSADFIHADMASLVFDAECFDAVVALYSLIHLPRSEHKYMLESITKWLRPGGILLATMGATSVEHGFEKDWLGFPMYWSHFDSDTNKRLIRDAGLNIVTAEEETAIEHGEPVTFLWVIACRRTE
jgi:RimJ/RimL family protein N-acetyltransferase/predicted TPR repeat methyltransferase